MKGPNITSMTLVGETAYGLRIVWGDSYPPGYVIFTIIDPNGVSYDGGAYFMHLPQPSPLPSPPSSPSPPMSQPPSPPSPPSPPPSPSSPPSPLLLPSPPPPACPNGGIIGDNNNCNTCGDQCTMFQICTTNVCTFTTVTFYEDNDYSNPTFTGNSPVAFTPARCICLNLEDNGYSGFSFNVGPDQLATYTGTNCTNYMHVPNVDSNATCYNGTLGDQNVTSSDIYCDSFLVDGDYFIINDQLMSLEVCDNLPITNIPPPLSPPPPSPPLLQLSPPLSSFLGSINIETKSGFNYTTYSYQLSVNEVLTNVINNNNELILTMKFVINNTTVTTMLNQDTFDIPDVHIYDINSSLIYTFNIVATYVATELTVATIYPNNTGSRRKLLRAVTGNPLTNPLINHPGCDDFVDTACTIPCCEQHDVCYYTNHCSRSSWFGDGSYQCILCNIIVVGCLLSTGLRDCADYCDTCGHECTSTKTFSNKNSCFDSQCGMSYDCTGGCPLCPSNNLSPNECCNCDVCQSPPSPPPPSPPPPSPLPSPCSYDCQDGPVVTFANEDECIAFCTDASTFGGTCCADEIGLGYAFCVSLGQAGCALTCGTC